MFFTPLPSYTRYNAISGKTERRLKFFVKNADSGPSNRQTLKSGDYPEVEDALYTWFLQVCNRHSYFWGNYSREGKIFLQNGNEKR
jgi:hypothetical protein